MFLTLLKPFLPYIGVAIAAFSLGFGGAWKIQGLNVTAVEQEFTTYRQTQTSLIQAEKDRATLQREKAGKDYEKLSNILNDEINSHVVYQRCVAAGKCGVRVRTVSSCTGIHLPAATGTDETRPDAISLIARAAEADPVVNDCAVTTLMLNQIQMDIENQPGYSQ